MRAHGIPRPLILAAVFVSLIACIDRGNPTDPTTPTTPSGVITVAVRTPAPSLEVGTIVAVSATATNQAGEIVQAAPVQWSSSDTSILSISTGGQVSGRKMGSATIYATSEGVSGQAPLAVTDSVPASVDVQPSVASATVGGQVTLSATIKTKTGRVLTGHAVTWSSTDSHLATVSPSGTVTGASTGTAKIIAKASSVSDSATVGVASTPISTLSITPSSSSISSGTTVQLTAHASDASGNELTGRAVAWASSNSTVASVSTGGLVTGSKAGSATLTATAEGKNATATITIVAGAAASVSVTPGSLGLAAGSTQQLSATIKDGTGNVLSDLPVSWSSSNSSVGTVSSSGLVTASQAGSATITAASNGKSGSATLIVSAGAISSVVVSPASLNLSSGATQQLSATVKDGSGNVITSQSVAWSSSDPSIGSVSANGTVTASNAGTTTIIAAVGGKTGSATLSVAAGAVSSVSITPGSATLVAGSSQQLSAVAKDGSGNVVAGATIAWSTSDASIAAVSSSGVVTGAHIGPATITASTGGTSASATVAVSAGAVNSISVTPASGSMRVASTVQLSANAADVAGNSLAGTTFTWTSGSASIATTSSSGLVTGVAVGATSITASAGGKSKSAAITVTAPPPPPPPAPPPPPPPPPPGSTQATWSDSFVGSIGISSHFSYWDQLPYGNNLNQTLASLKAAGFRWIRDGLNVDSNAGWNDRYWGIMKTITQQGQQLLLITQPGAGVSYPYANQSNLDTALDRIGTAGILGFEGPNEVDNNSFFWGGASTYGNYARTYQIAMYTHAKQIAPSVPVIGLTATSPAGAIAVGDLSSYMDAGTMHPYPVGGVPMAEIPYTLGQSAPLNRANKGWWVTETGYHNAPNATVNLFQPGVSEQAQGKYVDRIYLDYFNAGITHTSVYELADGASDPTNAEMNYGLLRSDGSAKPAYNAVKNMIALLADPGSPYTASSLSYSLSGTTGTIRQALFQKRDGRFYLALWNDVLVYNTASKRDIANAPVPVTVTFAVAHNVSVYQPYTQPTAVSTSGSVTSLAVAVPDHPVILEVSP